MKVKKCSAQHCRNICKNHVLKQHLKYSVDRQVISNMLKCLNHQLAKQTNKCFLKLCSAIEDKLEYIVLRPESWFYQSS